jgi:hypothetical protein
MSEVLTIKQIADDLKRFLADEAKRNARSMDKEIIRVLEEERVKREAETPPVKDMGEIMDAARRLQDFRVLGNRAIDDLLYDREGMPK